MKNMKIPVENNLDEIVVELERLGYVNNLTKHFSTDWICIGYNDLDDCYSFSNRNSMPTLWGELTTLAELKGMK